MGFIFSLLLRFTPNFYILMYQTEFYNFGLALFYLSIVLKSMNTRQPSGQKFFRRTSKSPWEPCRAGHLTEQPNSNYQPVNYPHVSLKSKNSSIHGQEREFSVSITNIPDENNENANGNKINADLKKYNGNEKFNRNVVNPAAIPKHPEEIKFTYIPIQSMSTVNTLPATQKKISETFEGGKTLITKEDYQGMKKEIEVLKEENRKLSEIERVKSAQKTKLLKQLQLFKKNNSSLESDIKKLKDGICEAERNLKISEINNENLKRNLQVTQFLKARMEESLKEAKQNLFKAESELRSSKDQNGDLSRLIVHKQRELLQVQNELEREIKKAKSSAEALTDSKVLRTRSSTSQENTPPEQKDLRAKDLLIKAQPQRSTRHIQTDNCSLERALRQAQSFSILYQQKETTVKKMTEEIEELNLKMKFFDENILKIEELETLVGVLNEKIINDSVLRLSNKYRYC